MGRGLSSESRALIQHIYAVFEKEHPNSPRRVTYAIFGNRAGAMADKVGGLCGRMLDAGDLPLDWYDDSSRSEIAAYVVEDVDNLVAMKRGTPPFDPWASQQVRVKVWSEKSVGGTLDPVLQALSVPFLNTSGWNSRKMLMQEAQLTHADPRRLVILYVGDHDASGLRMSAADLPSRFEKYGARGVEIRRVAITSDDFREMRARGLTDPVKRTDPNARWYLDYTGQRVGVELETLPAPDLRARVQEAIEDCIENVAMWNQVVASTKAVRESWQAHVDRWPRPEVSIRGRDPEYGDRP